MEGENKMESEIKNDQELYSYFRGRNAALTKENFSYLMQHHEVKQLLNDYLANILLHKPDDVFKFTKDYFKFLSKSGESDKFTILVGPSSVGKTELLKKLVEEFSNDFEIPKFVCTKDFENHITITEEEFFDLQNKKELILYSYDNKNKFYEGLSQGEIQRINDAGKIAIMETRLSDALKINQLSIPANFIGVLPPSLDHLRARIEKHTDLKTYAINKELEIARDEIRDIETYTFFGYRITNDIFETGYKDLKNVILSLYPKFKYSDEEIEALKNMPDGEIKGDS